MSARLAWRPAAVALGACLLALLAYAAAAGAGPGGAPTGSAAPELSVHLHPPQGWVSRALPGGGVAASTDGAELDAAVPSAARITVRPAPAGTLDVATLLAGVDSAPFVGVPTTYPTSVAGIHALYVEWTAAEKAGDETTRTIVLVPVPGTAYVITLEAPIAKWTPSFPAFDSMLATITFTQAGTP